MRVLIVDDHTLVRRGIAHVIVDRSPDAEIREASTADEALEQLRQEPVDVALVDVRMPERDGLDLLRDIKASWPEIPVIMLSSYDQPEYVRAALGAGASGYLLKDSSPDDLHQAIRVTISGGGNVLSTRVMQSLFDADDRGPNGAPLGRRENLTQRETDILELLSEGRSNREISRRLFLSEKTVKAHLAAVFRKLGVSNRTQAAMAALRMGLGSGQPLERNA